MDKAQPGHTVEFKELKSAAHLNGTKGTLVKYLRKEQRWSVRCELDNEIVKAKPENLVLHRRRGDHPIIGGDFTPAQASRIFGDGGGPTPSVTASTASGGGPPNPSGWARGLSQKDQYEWLSNCYQMRCDDDYQWGDCNLHGPYNPDATPESIAQDFLVFCTLAHRHKAVPDGWDWPAFLQSAANYITFAFEKSDAKERWGSENFFEGQMGGRSLRFTGTIIYKSPVDMPMDSQEHENAEEESRSIPEALQKQVGGTAAWATLVENLGNSRRFAY